MERVSSLMEISKEEWNEGKKKDSKMMNRSESEFQLLECLKYLEPNVEEINNTSNNVIPCCSTSTSTSSIIDVKLNMNNNNDDDNNNNNIVSPMTKLNLACAAVAKLRDSVNPNDRDDGSLAYHPPLPALKEPAVPIRSTTSGSSDDAEDEGETNMNGDMNPYDEKRNKRKLSNRESARRSRNRKKTQLTELETQVSQLRDEKSSLLQRLADADKKYRDSDNENRVLQAQLEALRAQVKLAEAEARLVTRPGLNTVVNAMPEMSSILGMEISLFDRSPSESSADASVPVQDHRNNHFFQPTSTNLMSGRDMRGVNNWLGGNVSSAGGNALTKTNIRRV